ncbi:MAG: response regulator [Prolixibacteraceae bacterium]|jgi:DNA-binding NtrC family response regulator|nr:response regulator [Prolixibacteraceae bacterium]
MKSDKKTILYIDDEEINLRLLKATFRRNYQILTAGNAKEGLNILSKNKVDLIITDQRMPDITGVEFLKMVQEKWPEIPPGRLIISGYSDYEDIDEAYKNYQLFKFIAKPWKENELSEIIIKAIENE